MKIKKRHPFWKNVRVSKEFKSLYEEIYGLKIKRILVPKKKYYSFIKKLYEI